MGQKMRAQRGFSLIELLITVAIIGVLVAVAIPAFTDYLKVGRRADAHAGLQRVQLEQEKWRTNNSSYAGNIADVGGSGTTDGYYTLALSNVSATGYTVTATAQGAQAGDTGCTSITLTMNSGTITSAPSACWKK